MLSAVEFGLFHISCTLILLFTTLHILIKWRLSYWRNKGICGPKPSAIFGNFREFFLHQTSHTELFEKFYKEWKDQPFIGVFKGHMPMFIVHDLDIIKNIMIKDFNVFSTRGLVYNEGIDPLSAHLFTIDGERWKTLRTKLTPVFTTSKLKFMLDGMIDRVDALESHLRNRIGDGSIIEVREVAARFTIDVIGSCVFGIDAGGLDRENSEFRKWGRRLFASSYWTILKRNLRDSTPGLFKLLQLRAFDKESCDFFIEAVWKTIKAREINESMQQDLIYYLMEIKKNHNNESFELNDGLLAAQAFVFFAAGFETSSATIAFALYELAQAPELQDKLRKEICEISDKHDGKLSYDIVREMKYLDMVFNETLRKHPAVTVLERHSTQSYKIPGTDVTVDAGTKILIPIYGIQNDPKYYENPEIWDPERFTEEARNSRHPMTFLSFGAGPKNCIGIRFATFQVKLGIMKIVKNFQLKMPKETIVPYEIDRGTFLLTPKNGIPLYLEPIL